MIAGLGNPGLRYKNTRHNVGFLIVNEISRKFKIAVKKRSYDGLLGRGSIKAERVILFMPQTYMNRSGEAIREAVGKENIKFEDILVIYDDIDLKLGLMRLKKKGSSAGHKGLESVIESLGTIEIPRLRIGIGKMENVVDFVLSPFDSEEKPVLKSVIKEAVACVSAWVEAGPDKTMTRFNR